MAKGWVALLRAVNLGPRNRVPMAELRALLEVEGFEDVRTYIASGNVLFRAGGGRAALARRLEELIAARFGVETPVVLRSFDELQAVASGHPFGDETAQTHVTFLAAQPSAKAVAGLQALELGDDTVALVGADVYARLPNGVQGARASAAVLERQLGVPGTTRNWRTVTKLAELTRT